MSLPRLLILGTGFGAFNLIKHLKDDFELVVVSPRNHFLFTPLLPSTTVGTIEFRSIIEPIRRARKELSFFHAWSQKLDQNNRRVVCKGVGNNEEFTVDYDILVIAVGAVSNTFNVPGVEQYAYFLKELRDARDLRQRIITCFEQASLPGASAEERSRLLHFVICGGGPTGVEFAAELSDFLSEDLSKSYPHLIADVKITIVEALKEILNTFDEKLRRYAMKLFRRQHISILTELPVGRVEQNLLHLKDGTKLPFGLLLWSTGNAPTPFVKSLSLEKDSRSRLLVDEFFRARGSENIYAIGDCCVVERTELPATSQVAQQQGKYLARALTQRTRHQKIEPFRYKHLGMLAYIGGNRALADLENFKGRGWATWLFWRSTYLTKIVSLKNKVLVMFDWMKTQVFGRDISQF